MAIFVRKNTFPTHPMLKKKIPEVSAEKQHLKTLNEKFKKYLSALIEKILS